MPLYIAEGILPPTVRQGGEGKTMNLKALQEFYETQRQIAELTKQADALTKTLKTEIPRGEHTFGEWKVSFVERTRIDLDKGLVEQALGEKVKECERISAYEVFMVKKI